MASPIEPKQSLYSQAYEQFSYGIKTICKVPSIVKRFFEFGVHDIPPGFFPQRPDPIDIWVPPPMPEGMGEPAKDWIPPDPKWITVPTSDQRANYVTSTEVVYNELFEINDDGKIVPRWQ